MLKLEDLPPGIHEWALYLRNLFLNTADHEHSMYLYFGLGFLLCLLLAWARNASKPPMRGKVFEMGTKERRRETDTIVADMVTNGLEELEFTEKLTRKEVDYYYKQFTLNSRLPGLQPQIRRRTNYDVRMEIVERRGTGPYHKPDPLPFPDEPAKEKPPTQKTSLLTTMLSKGKSKMQTSES